MQEILEKNNEQEDFEISTIIQLINILKPEQKNRLYEIISPELSPRDCNDSKNHHFGFFSELKPRRKTSGDLVKRSSSKKLIPKLNLQDLGSKPPVENKVSPVKSPRDLLYRITHRKKGNDSLPVEVHKKAQMPIDEGKVKIFLQKFSEIVCDKAIMLPADDQYHVIILPLPKKKHKYFLIDKAQKLGIGAEAQLHLIFDLENSEPFVAKIFKRANKSAIKSEILGLQQFNRYVDRCYLENGEIAVISHYIAGTEALNVFYEINTFSLNPNDHYINKKYISPFIQIRIAYHLLEQLIILREHKLLHRDIKPENLMIEFTEDNNLRLSLIDFDLCVSKDQVPFEISGTKGYIPPELFEYQACGFVHLSFNPTQTSFDNIAAVTNNNHALILYDDMFFYADMLQRDLIKVVSNLTTQLVDFFPKKLDYYVEIPEKYRQLIIKLTNRPLKFLYNEYGDIYQAGLVLAEMISKENYRLALQELLANTKQNITLDVIKKMIPDVFNKQLKGRSHPNDNIVDNFIDIIDDTIIHTILQDLVIRMIEDRLVGSSFEQEIERLKIIEQFCCKMIGIIHSLTAETSNALNYFLYLKENIRQFENTSSIIKPELLEYMTSLFSELLQNYFKQDPEINGSPKFQPKMI